MNKQTKWENVPLSSLYSIKYGKANPNLPGQIPVIGSSGIYAMTQKPLVYYPTIVIGRKGSAGQAWLVELPSYPSDTTFYLEPKKEAATTDIRFVYFTLKKFQLVASDDVIPSLQRHVLENMEIPLPSISEQKIIVTILSRIQMAIGAQEKTVAIFKELKSATMAKLFREGLRGEPLKQTEIGEMPESWEIASISKYCEKPRYGYTASASTQPNGPKFLRITDITEEGVNWNTVPYCSCPQSKIDTLRLKSGDLVFARIGATTGKSFLIENCPEAVFASYLIRLRTKAGLDPTYLSCFFESQAYWRQVRANKGNNLKGGMNASILSSLIFPAPPLAEQKEISSNLMVINQRIALAVKQRKVLQSLFSSMLHLLMTGQVRVNNLNLKDTSI